MEIKTTTIIAINKTLKHSPILEGNTCIAESHLEVLP